MAALSYEQRLELRAALDSARRLELAQVTRRQQVELRCTAYAMSGRACKNRPQTGGLCRVHLMAASAVPALAAA